MPNQNPTYTLEEVGKRVRAGNPEAFANFSDTEIGERAVQRKPELKSLVSTEAPKEEPKKDGFFTGLVKGALESTAKLGVQGANLFEGVAKTIGGDYQGAQEALDKSRDLPFFGKTAPVVKGSDEFGNSVKKTIGAGLDIGSNFAGGGAATNLGRQTFKGLLKQGIKQGAKEGLIIGGVGGFGRGLEDGKTIGGAAGQAVVEGAVGGLSGAALGGALQAVSPVIGKAKTVFGRNKELPIVPESPVVPRQTGGAAEMPKNVHDVPVTPAKEPQSMALRMSDRAKKNYADFKSERAEIKKLPAVAQDARKNGIEARDVNLVMEATPTERKIGGQMAERAKNYAKLRKAEDDPALIVGQEFRKRLTAQEKEREVVGKQLGEFARGLKSAELKTQPQMAVAERLSEVPGLEDINLTQDGQLDFSRTSLSGSLTKGDRDAIQEAFDDIANRDPYSLHKMRQELFEVLGGKKRSGNTPITDTQERGFEAIRQGLADVLEEASPNYKKLNQTYAKIASPLQDLRRYFKNVNTDDADILDLNASVLARRLTSNAQSNPQLRAVLKNMEDTLQERGVKFDTRVDTIQEMLNALARYYDITRDTSLAGQVSIGVNGGLGSMAKDLVIQGAQALGGKTPAVKQASFERMLRELGTEKPTNFGNKSVMSKKSVPKKKTNFGRAQ